ncbi:MAG: uroporphyrinogen decarboxylase family protein [Oscillospiraceae bacterium]|jgi:uroporphyrinogen decarboxylase|nr:uroporphyrinogen decarboxylase family protein [Oscillospiraceae bacterium]
MTERERFCKTLRRESVPGLVPTFELEFYLTMEALGRVHPSQRGYRQWKQMSERERELHLRDEAEVFVAFARKYHHSAIHVNGTHGGADGKIRVLEHIRAIAGDEFALLVYCDPTFSIPSGGYMMEFTERLYEDGEGLHEEAKRNTENVLRETEKIAATGLVDGVCMCSDYCFNANPFFSRDMFAEFIAPYLRQSIEACHAMGLLCIKHTDGNIMPIIDQMVACGPDALHSLDPQGEVDLAQVSRDWGDQVALCGNVNCALLQTGTQAECEADIRRALHDGMARGRGYVFCTSNCAYTGLALERYECMNRIWREEGSYGA